MDHIFVKIFNVTLWPETHGTYYVKLRWRNKKYKTKKCIVGLLDNEELFIPVGTKPDDKEKLSISVWRYGMFSYKLAESSMKFKDIRKNKCINKEIIMCDVCIGKIMVNFSACLKSDIADVLLNKMIAIFPNIRREQIQHVIAIHKVEEAVTTELCKISNIQKYDSNNQGQFLTNQQYPFKPTNTITTDNNAAGMNMNNTAYPGQPQVMVNNNAFSSGVANRGLMAPYVSNTHMCNSNVYPIGTMSPYADMYIYRSSENKKKALLIGVNYYGTKKELHGCVNDTLRMKNLLMTKYGFHDSPLCMLRLIDNESNPNYRPTKKNILAAMSWLTNDAKKGDVLFFLFSGHGSQKRDEKNIEEDGYNETILPSDYKTEGEIIDDDLHRYLVQPLSNGVKLIAVMDCCHSGTSLDLSYEYMINSKTWREIKNPFHVICDVSQFGSCRDAGVSYEVDNKKNAPGSSLVNAMIQVISTANNALTYEYLLDAVSTYVRNVNKNQPISFMSSQTFSISNRIFDFDNILENKNVNLGQNINYVAAARRR